MTRALILLAMVVGCGEGTTGAELESEGWIDSAPPGPPNQRPGAGEDEDEEDDEDGEGTWTAWGIFGVYADGQLTDAEGEFFAEEDEVEVCLLFFPVTVRAPLDTCTQCTAAWELELGTPEPEIDVDSGCQRHAPTQIEGLVLRLGFTSDGAVMHDDGEGWTPNGEAFTEDDELILEWEN